MCDTCATGHSVALTKYFCITENSNNKQTSLKLQILFVRTRSQCFPGFPLASLM